MRIFKFNMNYVNCALLIVVLILVVVCCVKKPTEGFVGFSVLGSGLPGSASPTLAEGIKCNAKKDESHCGATQNQNSGNLMKRRIGRVIMCRMRGGVTVRNGGTIVLCLPKGMGRKCRG
jgi:hypothetical protein